MSLLLQGPCQFSFISSSSYIILFLVHTSASFLLVLCVRFCNPTTHLSFSPKGQTLQIIKFCLGPCKNVLLLHHQQQAAQVRLSHVKSTNGSSLTTLHAILRICLFSIPLHFLDTRFMSTVHHPHSKCTEERTTQDVANGNRYTAIPDEFANAKVCAAVEHADGDEEVVCYRMLQPLVRKRFAHKGNI